MRYVLLITVLIACTSAPVYKKRSAEELYSSAGIYQFLLPDLPIWARGANHDGERGCRQNTQIKFVDYHALGKSMDFSYAELVQFQALFNIEKDKQLKYVKSSQLTVQEIEKTFYFVSERIQQKFYAFDLPKFKRIHVVWIDPVIDNRKSYQKLISLVSQENFYDGIPVFISRCLGWNQLQKFVTDLGLNDEGVKIISSEFFSYFNHKLENNYIFQLELDKFLEGKNIWVYGTSEKPDFLGEYKYKKF